MSDTIRRAQGGERAAIDKLFREHLSAVYRYALRLCGDLDRARDVAQDSLLTAFRSLDSYRGEASFSTWLFTITRSHCGRARQRQRRELSGDDDDQEQVISLAPTPDLHVAHSEVSDALEGALDALDPSDRQVVWLRDVEGVSTKDAASSLGLSVTAFKSRLHRARTQLRALVRRHRPSGLNQTSEG